MKEGARLSRQTVDPDHLLLMVERALTRRRLATENMILRTSWRSAAAPLIVGDADARLGVAGASCGRPPTTVLLGEAGPAGVEGAAP
jgi:hypothetical protein